MGACARSGPDGSLTLHAQVTSLDGVRQVSGSMAGGADAPEELGAALAAELVGRGAGSILADVASAQRTGR
ncbi:hypothetical protein V2S66_29650 [Streptomyces sp. V4-01]|uniref:Lipoprotein n=1 Tax=Actinacidiphila polyblastidii TaxID=3110430 RepID=A0ABU7PKA0_9ACTN|nr:hypothetical protein [Streptomyces sp. V4-01]